MLFLLYPSHLTPLFLSSFPGKSTMPSKREINWVMDQKVHWERTWTILWSSLAHCASQLHQKLEIWVKEAMADGSIGRERTWTKYRCLQRYDQMCRDGGRGEGVRRGFCADSWDDLEKFLNSKSIFIFALWFLIFGCDFYISKEVWKFWFQIDFKCSYFNFDVNIFNLIFVFILIFGLACYFSIFNLIFFSF